MTFFFFFLPPATCSQVSAGHLWLEVDLNLICMLSEVFSPHGLDSGVPSVGSGGFVKHRLTENICVFLLVYLFERADVAYFFHFMVIIVVQMHLSKPES